MKKKRTWKRPAHGGGHLETGVKNQTPLEFSETLRYSKDTKARWDYLFSLNKRPFDLESIPSPKGDRLEEIRKEVDKVLADFRQSIIDGK